MSGGLEFTPGSTHYLLSIRDSASNDTECEKNLKLLLMVGATVVSVMVMLMVIMAMVIMMVKMMLVDWWTVVSSPKD